MLYKDPSGSRVFAAHVKTLEIRAISDSHYERQDRSDVNERQDRSDVDALRQRVKQLEEELTKHNVVDVKPVSSSYHALIVSYTDTMGESITVTVCLSGHT